MRRKKSTDGVLGVFVAPNQVEAVLLSSTDEGATVIGRYTRPRISQGSYASKESLASAVPGLRGSDDSDFTIQVGDGGGGGRGGEDLFLESELANLTGNGKKSDHMAGTNGAAGKEMAKPFLQQIKEILSECATAGYPHPDLSFCIQPPDVSYISLMAPAEDTAAPAKSKGLFGFEGKLQTKAGGSARRQLQEWLKDHHDVAASRERASFVPMAPRNNVPRYLALVPELREPVTPTMEMLRRQQGAPDVAARMIDAELSLIRSIFASSEGDLKPAAGKNSAVIRVGNEDTLVLFFSGSELRHFERLRSLTTYDSPQTICSRVLLQQDEQKIGAVDRLFLLSDSRTEQLLDSFATFYEGAEVRPFADLLFEEGLKGLDDNAGASTLLATAAGLRLSRGFDADGVNLMPLRLRSKRQKGVAVAWHTIAMMVVLFATTLFFVYRFQQSTEEVRQARLELATNPPEAPAVNPAMLQHRVDSLQAAYALYTRSLATLDSLLLGSDRWSRFLESTSRSTGNIPGIWINSWSSTSGNVKLDGAALSRTRVAQLARRMNGSIEKISSFEVRADGRPVGLYNFTMTVPVPVRMPYVAEYLQEVAMGEAEPPQDEQMVRPEDMHFHEDTPMTSVSRQREGQ